MPRYQLMICDAGNRDVWYRAGSRLRMCLDQFDTPGEAFRQVDVITQLNMPLATGMTRLKVVDTKTSEDVSRSEVDQPAKSLGGAISQADEPVDRSPSGSVIVTSELSTEIREARMSMGLSQKGLGELLEVSQGTICQWERGSRQPRGSRKERVLEWLDEASNPSNGRVPRA